MFVNMTQHDPSPAQVAEGVQTIDHDWVKAQLTFKGLPPAALVKERANALATWAKAQGADRAMVGGAPWLMGPLERALVARGVEPLYAFSNRQSTETVQQDGSVLKVQEFVHLGFLPAIMD